MCWQSYYLVIFQPNLDSFRPQLTRCLVKSTQYELIKPGSQVARLGNKAMSINTKIISKIKGKKVSYSVVSRLSFLLNEEYALPYFFDVVHYEKITEPKLVEHIDRVGKIIYQKSAE